MLTNDESSRNHIVFLDSLALMQDPGLLDLSHPGFSLWITRSVMKSVEDSAQNSPHPLSGFVKDRLAEALESRRISYNPVDFTGSSPLPNMFGTYADVLKHALITKERGERVTLVTTDPTMREGAEALGVDVLDPEGLKNSIATALQAEKEAALNAERERKHQRELVLVRILFGLLIGVAGIIVWEYRDLLIENITAYGVLGVVAIIGIALYALRGRYRLVYGIAEAVVGYFTAAKIVFPPVDVYSIGAVEGIGILGGLYIIVRGLDNIGKGLEKTPYEGIWQRYSGEMKA